MNGADIEKTVAVLQDPRVQDVLGSLFWNNVLLWNGLISSVTLLLVALVSAIIGIRAAKVGADGTRDAQRISAANEERARYHRLHRDKLESAINSIRSVKSWGDRAVLESSSFRISIENGTLTSEEILKNWGDHYSRIVAGSESEYENIMTSLEIYSHRIDTQRLQRLGERYVALRRMVSRESIPGSKTDDQEMLDARRALETECNSLIGEIRQDIVDEYLPFSRADPSQY